MLCLLCIYICFKGFSKHTPTQLYLGWKTWGDDVFRFKRNYYFRRYMEAIFFYSIFLFIYKVFYCFVNGIIKIEIENINYLCYKKHNIVKGIKDTFKI